MEGYPRQEMDLKLKAIDTKVETHHVEIMRELQSHNDVHRQILNQTKLTNGRVKSLEIWRSFLLGVSSVLTILVLPLVFILLKQAL